MHTVSWWTTVTILSLASAVDVRTRRIPNWLTIPFFVAGLIAQTVAYGWNGLETGFAGAALAFLLFAPGCFFGWMGMGDLKLATAAAAWIGPQQFLWAFLAMGMAGGVLATFYAVRRGPLLETRTGRPRRAMAIP